MQIRIIAFTKQGVQLAQHLTTELSTQCVDDEIQAYTLQKYSNETVKGITESVKKWTGKVFSKSDALIYIGATGIAVRSIAPYLKDKWTDPAVLALDEKGDYVISLLSGHIGGANDLARRIAKMTKGVPIVSTATDVQGLFAVDEWAHKKGLTIKGREEAKLLSSYLLEEKTIRVKTPFDMRGQLPKHFIQEGEGDYTLTISEYAKKEENTLQLIPKVLTLGIGCRRGTSLEKIEQLVLACLEKEGLAIEAIRDVASIDLKQDEEGLLGFAKKYQLQLHFFSSQTLAKEKGEFTSSVFVQQITQVDNVCERAAVVASKGKLIQRKVAREGVTLAIAVAPYTIEWTN